MSKMTDTKKLSYYHSKSLMTGAYWEVSENAKVLEATREALFAMDSRQFRRLYDSMNEERQFILWTGFATC